MLDKIFNSVLGFDNSADNIRAYRVAQFVVLVVSVLSIFSFLISLWLLILGGAPYLTAISIGLTILYPLNILILRLTRSSYIAGIIFLSEQLLSVIFTNYIYGGHETAIYIWFPVMIMSAVFVLGKRSGLVFTAFLIGVFFLFQYLSYTGFAFPQEPLFGERWTREQEREWSFLLSFPVSLLITSMLCWLFVKTRESTEDQLEESEQRLRLHVERTPLAVIEWDTAGRVTKWNSAAEDIFGYPREEVLGRKDPYLFAEAEDAEAVMDIWCQLMQNAEGARITTKSRRKDGSSIDCDWYHTPLVNEQNRVIGVASLAMDVTERKLYERELEYAKCQAEDAVQVKGEFLANMSHEIRTPMNGVIGMTSLLLDTELDELQQDFVSTIRGSSEALLTIINDILDFSKIESGKLQLENQPFDLRQCVEEALDLLVPTATEKKLELAYMVDPEVPNRLTGDVTRLRQVLVNLVANAVKFTSAGEVFISVDVLCREADEWKIHFAIRDTGIGIPKEQLFRLFQSFSQVDTSTTRRYGGTGLGLAISKQLSELMGGTMWVESTVNVGSIFHFTVQAKAASCPQPIYLNDQQPTLESRRVLVVDDNGTNRRILERQLEQWGMDPYVAISGAEALSALASGERFDLALLDMHMPEMDGLALAKHIRKEQSAEAMPIIMLTSINSNLIAQMATELGIAAHLYKPVKPAELYAVLTQIFGQQVLNSEQAAFEQSQKQGMQKLISSRFDSEIGQRHKLNILLAEDNGVNQKVALRILERLGYRADIVSDGAEAVEAVSRQRYDVVLMDVQMPEMDGLDATRHIRQILPEAQQPTIVAMTAGVMPRDRAKCLEVGMDNFLAKPINVEHLIEVLLGCHEIVEKRIDANAQRQQNLINGNGKGNSNGNGAGTHHGHANGSMAQTILNLEIWDEFQTTMGFEDPNYVSEVVSGFLVDAQKLAERIRKAIEEQNAHELMYASHSLKSSSGVLGAMVLSGLCDEFEEMARDEDITEAGTLLSAFNEQLYYLPQALNSELEK